MAAARAGLVGVVTAVVVTVVERGWLTDVLLFESAGNPKPIPVSSKMVGTSAKAMLFLLCVTLLAVRQKNLLVQNGSTWSYCPLSVRFPSLCPLCLSALVHW